MEAVSRALPEPIMTCRRRDAYRARGWEWVAQMEEQAIAGDPGAQWILPRRVADIYGTKQTIDIGSASPASEVAGLLDRIAEVRANEPG
jgi:hypothetical protein